jgi:hypothetical protein
MNKNVYTDANMGSDPHTDTIMSKSVSMSMAFPCPIYPCPCLCPYPCSRQGIDHRQGKGLKHGHGHVMNLNKT